MEKSSIPNRSVAHTHQPACPVLLLVLQTTCFHFPASRIAVAFVWLTRHRWPVCSGKAGQRLCAPAPTTAVLSSKLWRVERYWSTKILVIHLFKLKVEKEEMNAECPWSRCPSKLSWVDQWELHWNKFLSRRAKVNKLGNGRKDTIHSASLHQQWTWKLMCL